jgi:hypothetical protein
MIKPAPNSSGIGGVVLLFCIAALLAGVFFDVLNPDDSGFPLAQQPGSRAFLGAGVAVAAVLLAYAVRLALARKRNPDAEGGDAGAHS